MTITGLRYPGGALTPLVASLFFPCAAPAQEMVRLEERFPPGYQYRVQVRVDLAGSLTLPAQKGKTAGKPLSLNGDSVIDYDERILAVDKDGAVWKTFRVCRRTDFRRTLAGQVQEATLRPAVRRLVILRKEHTDVPFSPDGPLTRGEIDLIRTDVFSPALAGLLPDHPVRTGDRWHATDTAVRELTELGRIDEGKLECRLEQLAAEGGKHQARVALSGTVRGLNEDGPNRQTLEGYFEFDLGSNHLSYLYLKGVHAMLDKDGREVGRIEGRFAMTRQAGETCPELSDEALKDVTVEPDGNNSLLLFDEPALGLRFLYPRRWRVTAVRGAQVTLDGADGSGLLLTVDPADRVPDGARFLAESRAWVGRQQAPITGEGPVRRVRDTPPLEQFALETALGGQKVLMDYYVTRQPAGGATLAARLLPVDRDAARRDLEKLALSIVVTKPTGTAK